MKKFLILVLSLVCMTAAKAKDKVEATIGADLVSQYIWRGQNLGHVSFQPTLGVDYKGLSLSAWGSVGISKISDPKELDLTLEYTYKGFNVGVTDYWLSEGSYFQYHAHKRHMFGKASLAMISAFFPRLGTRILLAKTDLMAATNGLTAAISRYRCLLDLQSWTGPEPLVSCLGERHTMIHTILPAPMSRFEPQRISSSSRSIICPSMVT